MIWISTRGPKKTKLEVGCGPLNHGLDIGYKSQGQNRDLGVCVCACVCVKRQPKVKESGKD